MCTSSCSYVLSSLISILLYQLSHITFLYQCDYGTFVIITLLSQERPLLAVICGPSLQMHQTQLQNSPG